MNTSTVKTQPQVGAKDVQFSGDTLCVVLTDAREIRVRVTEVPWLRWLATATPQQRANWSLEPGGFAIYWNELDDGVEVCHLLDVHAL